MTINELLAKGAVPIINENDTVTTHEIRYGDNVQLASFVCGAIGGDLVILLTDVDGLFSENPSKNKNAKFLDLVERITPEIMKLGGGAGSSVGTGGMATKLLSAKYATEKAGANLIIANSAAGKGNPLSALRSDQTRATLFTTQLTPAQAYFQTLVAGASNNQTSLLIKMESARKLATESWDVLPADVLIAVGSKDRGEAVALFALGENDNDFERIGFAVLEHSLAEIEKIKGITNEKSVAAELGYKGRYAVVKQQNLYLRPEFVNSVLKQKKILATDGKISKL